MHETEIIKEIKKRFPKRTNEFFNSLSNGRDFFEAIKTDIGKQLLTEGAERLDHLHNKLVIDIGVTDEEKAEIKVLRGIITNWSKKILKYQSDKQIFDELGSK